ncbi:MAG: UDP-N-acetylglucosamine 1-carboxyvinyltransferase [Thermodesulfovibrionales bacterium]|nr:UDP-N-acetylglucosamine 1-carboxyvinyltransferase [Thermodesulfovibrionales bacterium]
MKGEVIISGAKNSALPILASSILTTGKCVYTNIPKLRDIMTMKKLIENLGAVFSYNDGTVEIDTTSIKSFEAPYDLVKTMRASVLVLGPLVAKFGRAKVSLPGGCAIGERPIDLHLKGLEKMGASIELESGYVIAKARKLYGTNVYMDIPSVTGTENIMMAATLAKGVTIIENAAREPEVVDLANCLISMGAKIEGAGESIIKIEGVNELNPPTEYEIIPDRIEAGTFMIMAAITGGEVLLKNCRLDHLDAVISKLEDTGIRFEHTESGLKVSRKDVLLAKDIKTMPYPGFPTDMQAQFMALMCLAKGTSIIRETIFENRFMHVAELRRFGADISIEGSVATVRGVEKLKGAPVMATDLRASASLVIAALAAKGESVIHRIYHLDRGYEHLDEKLRKIGADIQRVSI